jgi:NADH-quinone oxidoreductase subunit J
MWESIVFYSFSAILLASAIGVISVRNPVHSVLLLVLAFFNAAAIWLLLEAEFLAIALVLVYVGAVMVLFLFVVMMLDIGVARLREGFARYVPLGALVALVVAGQMFAVVGLRAFDAEAYPIPQRADADYSSTALLGKTLFTEHVLAFEMAAILLLVAIVAAIMITLRRRPDSKYQDASRQVRVHRDDRVRLVRMADASTSKPEEPR